MRRNGFLLPFLLCAILPCHAQIAAFNTADVSMTSTDTRAVTVSKGGSPATMQFTADPSPQCGDVFQVVAPDATFGVSLITPGGVTITSANASAQGYTYEVMTTGVTNSAYLFGPLGTPGTQTVIILGAGCAPGSYQVKIDPSQASASATVIATYSSSSSVGVGLVTDAPSYRTGDTVVLTGVVMDGSQAITGASASARVGTPLVAGASSSQVTLTDSGNGLYTGTAVASTPGTYTAALRVTGTSASGVAFSRTVTTTFSVVAALAKFAGFTDSAVDTNSDGVLEGVAVAVGLKVTTAGNYRLTGTLQASNGQQILSNLAVNLTTSTTSTSLVFPSSDILRLGADGPYEIVNVLLLYEDDSTVPVADILDDAGKTQAYKLSSFGGNSSGNGYCSYTLAAGMPNPPSFTNAGGSGTAAVIAGANCNWTAKSGASWLTTSSSGSGTGTINYTVAANPGPSSRTGSITAGGQTLIVTQSPTGGSSCSYTLVAGTPNPPSFTSTGGSGTATVTAGAGCTWTATSSDTSWLTTSSSGNGNGTVNYTVAANTGASSRTGTITAGGQTLTVTQAGGSANTPGLGTTNVALNKAVTVNSKYPTIQGTPSAITSAPFTSSWYAYQGAPNYCSLIVDLGQTYSLGVIEIQPMQTFDYQVYGSTDGVNYTPIASYTWPAWVNLPVSIAVNGKSSARYIKYEGHTPWNQYVGLGGLRVYEWLSSAPAAQPASAYGTTNIALGKTVQNLTSYTSATANPPSNVDDGNLSTVWNGNNYAYYKNNSTYDYSLTAGGVLLDLGQQVQVGKIVVTPAKAQAVGMYLTADPTTPANFLFFSDQTMFTTATTGSTAQTIYVDGRITARYVWLYGWNLTPGASAVNPGIAEIAVYSFNAPTALAHAADGNKFQSQVLLINSGTSPAPYTLRFDDEGGNVPSSGFQLASGSLTGTIAAGQSATIQTSGLGSQTYGGWAELTVPSSVGGSVIYSQQTGLPSIQEGTANVVSVNSLDVFVPFDNTSGAVTSMAITNPGVSIANIAVTLRYSDGTSETGTYPAVPSRNHKAFVIQSQFPNSAQRSGVAEFTSSVPVSVVAFRFNSTGAFTAFDAVPASTNSATITRTLAHAADGNSFKTEVLLTNPSLTPAPYILRFDDNQGNIPAAGFQLELGSLMGTIPPGQSATIRTAGLGTQTYGGWAELTAPTAVGGSVVYSQKTGLPSIQEGTATIVTPGSSDFFVPFDNTNGAVTSMALTNPGGSSATINVTLRYSDGTSETVSLPSLASRNHTAFQINQQFPNSANRTGVAEFASNTPLSAVVFFFNSTGAFTAFGTVSR